MLTDATHEAPAITRRGFIVTALAAGAVALPIAGCSKGDGTATGIEMDAHAGGDGSLPAPSPGDDEFGIDKAINMSTIDGWLDRDDVAYRDMRMLVDPADYESIGGDSRIEAVIDGFRVVPYPLIGTLRELPVDGAYDGDRLYDVEWADDGSVTSAEPRYVESEMVLEDLFPRDRAIFLMCGGGGYADMTRSLLSFLGWDDRLLYNVGGQWSYQGNRDTSLIRYTDDPDVEAYETWRADYAAIETSAMHPIG